VAVTEDPRPPKVVAAEVASRRQWYPHAGAVVVLVVGLLLALLLAGGTRLLRNDNEDRLLHQRVHEAATVTGAAITTTHVPLAAAAALAETTGGGAKSFERLMSPETATGVPYVSASLWRTGTQDPVPLVIVGTLPKLSKRSPAGINQVLDRASGSSTLNVVNLLDGADRRLGYAQSVPGPSSKFVVYAESQLPKNRRARVAKNSAFADFDYALYLGPRPNPDNLLASSGGVEGRVRGASEVVPYGDKKLLVVLSPRTALGGTLLEWLPWALVLFGLIMSLAAAALVERLIRQREQAENLALELEKIAAENARLLADQRTVASTLQHSLLPESLPEVPGLDLGVRYVAGVEGVDIGGDWYDVLALDDGHVLFVVGDVSGRGLRAATIMASLRYAIHAYAAQGDAPTVILTKLSKLLSAGTDDGFATVLCGTIDVEARQMTIASAGHPLPLLIANGDAEFVAVHTGVPVGVDARSPYEAVTITVPEHATLLVYTDGLIERRGESLDVGLARLRTAALATEGSLEHLLTRIVDGLNQIGSDDDTALLGLRWRS
jgi:serine phosphatase RsbU (regulator of sigma subunit)